MLGDETLASTNCPYCDSPIVRNDQFSGGLKPDLIIPFQLNKEETFQVQAEKAAQAQTQVPEETETPEVSVEEPAVPEISAEEPAEAEPTENTENTEIQ